MEIRNAGFSIAEIARNERAGSGIRAVSNRRATE
jgi:hypothetical protein